MSTDTNILPVFVYGTLRAGLGNYENILRGNTVHEAPATLSGATMLDAGGFPFVIREGEGTIIGEVMFLDEDYLDYTMGRLDRLEGFRGPGVQGNMYEREQAQVALTDGSTVTAWVYITSPGFRRHTDTMKTITTGDWMDSPRLAGANR